MSRELKKMKPRTMTDTAEKRLRTVAIVMVLCLLLVIGIVVAISPGKSKKRNITAQTSQPTSSAAAKTADIETVMVPPLSVYRRRNIFKPLVSMEESSTPGAATTGVGTTGGAASSSPNYVTLPPELDASGQEVGTVISTAITLEGVFEQDGNMYARIRVGDNLFEKVAVGDVFADYYKMLAIGKDSSATILYGDERFSIFTGQSLYW
jgi:hypothetical protein